MKINGVHIHPGFFNRRGPLKEHRVGASPVRARRIAPIQPEPPRAMYLMPVVAVVAAVASFTAGAAIATAAGATLTAMVVGGAMMVGGALTAVGAVTGNQKLMKIGSVLSIAGGIGAGIAGAFGALTETAAGSVAAEVGSSAVSGGVDAAGLGIETAVDPASIATSLPPTTGADAGGAILGGGAPLDTAAQNAAQSTATAAAPTATAAPTAEAATEAIKQSSANVFEVPSNTASATFQTADGVLGGASAPGPSTLVRDPTVWEATKSFIKENPQMAKLIASTIGGVAGAIPSDLQKAQAEAQKANAALTQEQIAAGRAAEERAKRRAAYAQGKLYTPGG